MGHFAKKKRCISLSLTWWGQKRGCKWDGRSELLCFLKQSIWMSARKWLGRCWWCQVWNGHWHSDIRIFDHSVPGILLLARESTPLPPSPGFRNRFNTCGMVRIVSMIYFPASAAMIRHRGMQQALPDSPSYVISILYYPLSYFLMLLFTAPIPPFLCPNYLPNRQPAPNHIFPDLLHPYNPFIEAILALYVITDNNR